MMLKRLRKLAESGLIRPLDHQLAAVLADAGEGDESVLLGAALVSHLLSSGDVCVDLAAVAGKPLFDTEQGGSGVKPLVAPELAPWLDALKGSAFVGDGSEPAPLVLDGARLYLGRYHAFEQHLADWIKERVESESGDAGISAQSDAAFDELKSELNRLFPPQPDNRPDDQRAAAVVAVLRRFCVISGGPGTGKTTTVTRILALLLRLLGPLRIALAAPTGKAAARLSESLRERKPELDLPPELAQRIPNEVVTLHRLLGLGGEGSRPRYHAENPLHCDLLVVDEASMVDLSLMSRLMAALPSHARLILLGDKDQLASVEAGSVLGDICGTGSDHAYGAAQSALLERLCSGAKTGDAAGPAMADGIALLRHSYRFDAHSGIGKLARAVNDNDERGVFASLSDEGFSDLAWMDFDRGGSIDAAVGLAADAYADYIGEQDVAAALAAFGRFRLLCAVRKGRYGVKTLNLSIEKELGRRGLIKPDTPFYANRPLMITRNDYGLKLFNGDVGLVRHDPAADGALRAFFQLPDGSLRGHAVSRLPAHDTVFAMTVHKSQGSEFDQVLLMLPREQTAVATRELLYTGITRGKRKVTVAATEEALKRAIGQRNLRASGLREALWSAASALESG